MSRGSSLPCSVHRQVKDESSLKIMSTSKRGKEILYIQETKCKQVVFYFTSPQQQDYEQEFLQRRFSGGSQSYGGDSPRLSPCSSMGKLSKSDEQLSSMEQDSGQCSRNTSCETLGKATTESLQAGLIMFGVWCLHAHKGTLIFIFLYT